MPKRATDPPTPSLGSRYRAGNKSGALSIKSTAPSLGGDPRLIPSPSKKKYSEDVADRNIERSNTEHEAFQKHDISPPETHNFWPPSPDKRTSSRASSVPSSGAGSHSCDSQSKFSPSWKRNEEDVADRNIQRSVTDHERAMKTFSVKQSPVGTASTGRSPVTDVDSDDYMRAQEPHPHPHKISRKHLPHFPHLVARDESKLTKRTRRRNSRGEWVDDDAPQAGDYGPRITKEEFRTLNKASRKGQTGEHSRSKHVPICANHDGASLDYCTSPSSYSSGGASITSKESLNTERRWAPAVTREHIRPHQHHIRQERIYRDIHNHDVYHRIQPVVQTQILPAKHMVEDSDTGELTEVPDGDVPDRWKRREDALLAPLKQKISNESRSAHSAEFPSPQARLSSPKVVDEWTQITPGGTVRKDSVILHPSTLAPMGDFCGPVVPIAFCHHGKGNHINDDGVQSCRRDESLDSVPEVLPMTLKELAASLPEVDSSASSSDKKSGKISSGSYVRPPTRLSIRKEKIGMPAAGTAVA